MAPPAAAARVLATGEGAAGRVSTGAAVPVMCVGMLMLLSSAAPRVDLRVLSR